MPYVNVSEVGTFEEALSTFRSSQRVNIPHLASTTRREMAERREMIPTETLGRLWTATADLFPVEFALNVAEAHTETTKVYGQWGEAMDLTDDVRQRLQVGLKLMPAHTDDPQWVLKIGKGCFHFVRNWHYLTTTRRAEAFAAVSEFREWLIVIQRHIRQPIQPVRIEF